MEVPKAIWMFNGHDLKIFKNPKQNVEMSSNFEIVFRDFKYVEAIPIEFPNVLRDFQVSNTVKLF